MSAAEMREALKPCPFCCGEASKVTTFTGAFWFQCRGCGAQGPHKGVGDREIAWNRRALPDEDGMVERVADALRDARLTRPSIASRCVRMTDEAIAACVEDDLRDDARAAIRAINGGEP